MHQEEAEKENEPVGRTWRSWGWYKDFEPHLLLIPNCNVEEEEAACDGTLISEQRVGGADDYAMFEDLKSAINFAVMPLVATPLLG